MTPAVVVGCYTMGLGVIRSLGRKGIPVVAVHYDSSDIAQGSKYVSERVRVPHPEGFEREFIEVLVELGTRLPGAVLIPATDSALSAMARSRDILQQDFVVGFGDWDSVRRFIEKKRTYELANSAGVPIPRTVVPSDEADVMRLSREFQYPVLVKPSQGHLFTARFGTKMIEAKDENQLISAYQTAVDAGLEVMVQEIIPGPDSLVVNYNSLTVNGEPVVEFTARHVRNAPPGFGSPRVVVSEAIPEVLDPGRSIIEALGFEGFSCTEFKLDPRDGIYKLMEVNGRHNLSSLLAPACGIDFPWLHYRQLIDGRAPRIEAEGFTEGVYWIDLVRDVVTTVRSRDQESVSWREFLEPYMRKKVYAIASLLDPWPFVMRTVDMLRRKARSSREPFSKRTRQDEQPSSTS